MGLVDKIKQDVKKSGQNKGKFIYFREGQKTRLRFLTDMDDGMEATFHDSFERSINVPCQDLFGRDCPYCEDEGLRTRSQYIWSVYDYEAKEVKLFMFPVNNCSPVPGLMAMFENYGTLTDRDYVISVSGKGTNKTYSVVPMDKVKFRNEKAKPYAEEAILKMLDKAYPSDDIEADDDDDEEETTSRKRPSKPLNKKSSKRKSEPESEDDYDDDDYDDDFEDEDEDDWEEDESEVDYSELSAQELYKLCKERDIKVQPKKPAKFYIKQLEEYDQAQDDWGEDDWEEDDDEDEWEDD